MSMVFNEFLHFENNKKKDDVHKCSEHRIVPPQSERSQTQSSWGTFLTECALKITFFCYGIDSYVHSVYTEYIQNDRMEVRNDNSD